VEQHSLQEVVEALSDICRWKAHSAQARVDYDAWTAWKGAASSLFRASQTKLRDLPKV
jgi:hypothetical protein